MWSKRRGPNPTIRNARKRMKRHQQKQARRALKNPETTLKAARAAESY